MANETVQDVSGYDAITNAIMGLLNQYPALHSGETFTFSMLKETGGRAMFPTSGAIIQNEVRDILGHRTQYCLYPFYVIYRVGALTEARKKTLKEWLDNLGAWLEKQPIKVGNNTYTLGEYPTLTTATGVTRKITDIARTSPASLNAVNENNTEDWYLSVTLKYRNEY